MRRLYVQILIVVAALSAGCDATSPVDFEPEIVVEAYLESGDALPEVRISRTMPLDATYDANVAGVEDAAVTLRLLDSSGEAEESYEYRKARSRGIYLPSFVPGGSPEVKPLRMYELLVDVPGEPQVISSRTFVPDTFSVLNPAQDSVVYQASEQFTFLVSRTTYPGRQNVFLFTTFALDGRFDQLTPFARGLIGNSELQIEDLRERASPTLNEENFERTADDFLEIRFPWLGVYFFGRNLIAVNTLDDNLFDFIRSQSVQQGGSTLPPGEIPNVLEHIDGARGVFGSFARAEISVVVLRP